MIDDRKLLEWLEQEVFYCAKLIELAQKTPDAWNDAVLSKSQWKILAFNWVRFHLEKGTFNVEELETKEELPSFSAKEWYKNPVC